MARTGLLECCFLMFIVVFTKDVKSIEFETTENWFDFEQLKMNVFKSNLSEFYIGKSNDECLAELKTIGNGLRKFEPWAMKRKLIFHFISFLTTFRQIFSKKSDNAVLDAWGKIPSGILDGNFYEFGSFSECFHINKGKNVYNSKYCMGQLTFDLPGKTMSKSYQYDINNIIFGQDIVQTGDELQITPRMIIPP